MRAMHLNGPQSESEIRDIQAQSMQQHLELASRPRRPNTRRNLLLRTVYRLVFATDLKTLETVTLSFFGGFAFLTATLDGSTIATPPPYLQGYAVALPPVVWSGLLGLGVLWHGLGIALDRCPMRRNGSLALSIVACALCGALMARGPVLGSIIAFACLWQISVAARLTNHCSKTDDKGA